MLGVVLTTQLKENANLCSSEQEKRKFAENISGKLTSKYNFILLPKKGMQKSR